jgi:hypothetical protein
MLKQSRYVGFAIWLGGQNRVCPNDSMSSLRFLARCHRCHYLWYKQKIARGVVDGTGSDWSLDGLQFVKVGEASKKPFKYEILVKTLSAAAPILRCSDAISLRRVFCQYGWVSRQCDAVNEHARAERRIQWLHFACNLLSSISFLLDSMSCITTHKFEPVYMNNVHDSLPPLPVECLTNFTLNPYTQPVLLVYVKQEEGLETIHAISCAQIHRVPFR